MIGIEMVRTDPAVATRPQPASRARRTGTAGMRERTVTTGDGVRLAVRDYGSPTAGQTVVLLHGMCLDQDSWSIQVADLIRRWGNDIRVVTYDHRGHGGSENAPMHTYRIGRLADDLAEVLSALGVTGRLTLAGHSMGGMTALAYLGRPVRPVEVENLILVGAAAGRISERGVGRLLATPAAGLVYGLVRRGPRAVIDTTARFLGGPLCAVLTRYGGYGETARDALVTASAVNATPLTTKVGFLPGLKEHDQYATLATITAKTTVISGGADILTPPAHADELVAGIPGATHRHHAAAGHMLLDEVPEAVSEAICGAVAAGRPLATAA